MFSLFKKKYDPAQISRDLRGTILAPADEFALWVHKMGLTDQELLRAFFTLGLLPFIISAHYQASSSHANKALKDAIHDARDCYLGEIPDRDEMAVAGDYVVWLSEANKVSQILRDRYLQPVTDDMLGWHKVRRHILFSIILEVRDQQLNTDLRYALAQAPTGKPETIHLAFIQLLAVSFSKQVFGFGRLNSTTLQDETERVSQSLSLLIKPLSKVYLSVSRLVNSLK